MAVVVKINGNNGLEAGLKRFKTSIARSGTLSKAKDRSEGYRTRTQRKKEEKKINTMNSRRKARRNASYARER